MSRRSQLEHEVSVAQERIKKAAKDTPKDIIKLWEQDLVDLELELNNLVDDEEDNIQSPNQKIPDRKTKCVIKTHINIKQNVIFGAKLKPV